LNRFDLRLNEEVKNWHLRNVITVFVFDLQQPAVVAEIGVGNVIILSGL
jgi:hypothetical protein